MRVEATVATETEEDSGVAAATARVAMVGAVTEKVGRVAVAMGTGAMVGEVRASVVKGCLRQTHVR